MMKALLALAISGWLGWAGGALTDSAVPKFWTVWICTGVVLIFTTSMYVHGRRPT